MKEAELARQVDQEKALTASFMEAVGENKFKDFLVKVRGHECGLCCVCVWGRRGG